jgi:hypothetical protein
MAFRQRLDPRLARAARRMASLPAAEAWRRLRPVAATLGVRWPSYPTVRRLISVERQLRRIRRAEQQRRARLWTDVTTGRVPWEWICERLGTTEPG